MPETRKLSGGQLAGGNPSAGHRTDDDFYATDPRAVSALFGALSEHDPGFPGFSPGSFLEPCVGNGNIATATLDRFAHSLRAPTARTLLVDITDRGYPGTVLHDFLSLDIPDTFDLIVTNPPYSLALEFTSKALSLLSPGGYLAQFLKIQFWEGEKRHGFLLDNPPAFCFPFSKRMPTWNNGRPTDENGKRWATTMCHAWFVWKQGNSELCRTVPI